MVSVWTAVTSVDYASGLLCKGDHIRPLARNREPAPVVELMEQARFEQDPIRDRGRPVDCLKMLGPAPLAVNPGRPCRTDELRTLALMLLREGDPDFVLRINLPGQASLADVEKGVVEHALGLVEIERKLARSGKVGVEKLSAHEVVRNLRAERREEPQLVLLDWPAERRIDVRHRLDSVGSSQAPSLQISGEVVALHRFVRVGGEQGASEA